MTASPRITQRVMVEHSLGSLQTGLGRLATTQEQLSTGRVINRPSDSPTGTNSAMRLREQLAHQSQFSRNAQDGIARLGRIDSTLTSMLAEVRRVRDLALQAVSTGGTGPQAREALAMEVTQIREALLEQANTQHLGQPLFGGSTSKGAAYDVATGSYVGDTTEVHRRIDEAARVRVDVTGPELFGAPDGQNLFAVLSDVVANMTADPAALSGNLDDLDTALVRLQTQLADVGARYARLETAVRSTADAGLNMQAQLSGIENTDMARAMVDLQINEVAYQAALGATARVLQPSLIDFLR
jgi:flagellar hook-associated protein 3 FlgL